MSYARAQRWTVHEIQHPVYLSSIEWHTQIGANTSFRSDEIKRKRTPNELFRLDFDQLIKNQISKYNEQSMCHDKPDVTCIVVQRRMHSIRAVSWRRLRSSYISCGRSSEVISTHVSCTETLTQQAFISCSHAAHISVDPACRGDTILSSDDTSWSWYRRRHVTADTVRRQCCISLLVDIL